MITPPRGEVYPLLILPNAPAANWPAQVHGACLLSGSAVQEPCIGLISHWLGTVGINTTRPSYSPSHSSVEPSVRSGHTVGEPSVRTSCILSESQSPAAPLYLMDLVDLDGFMQHLRRQWAHTRAAMIAQPSQVRDGHEGDWLQSQLPTKLIVLYTDPVSRHYKEMMRTVAGQMPGQQPQPSARSTLVWDWSNEHLKIWSRLGIPAMQMVRMCSWHHTYRELLPCLHINDHSGPIPI